jgi:hypothetical protein
MKLLDFLITHFIEYLCVGYKKNLSKNLTPLYLEKAKQAKQAK